VQLSASADNKGTLSKIYVALGQIFSNQVSTAKAGMLELPGEIGSDEVDTGEVEHIKDEIIKTVSKVTGKDADKVTPGSRLADDIKATYVQRIKIVKDLERKFNLRIPYEHWNYLYTFSELVDYVHKRKIIEKKKEYRDSEKKSLDWPSIQQKTPIDQRPIFKR